MTVDETREKFLIELDRIQTWLKNERVPFAVVGSLAVSAYTDQGASIDFNRPGAYDLAQRMPDVDLLIPRDQAAKVGAFAESLKNQPFPVTIETINAYIDYRPESERSYLTHRQLQFPVRSELFEPRQARLLGQELTTLDPRTMLHTFGTVGGVIRKKDVPKMVALAEAIKDGRAESRFSERDCEVFSQYMVARKRQYPVFIATKQAWEGALEAMPKKAAQAIKHHILPAAHQTMAKLNRDRGDDRSR
ncbi:hypothetical protein GCM10009745_00990 [Kribbella yunnanensis]|uniref:Nucleotidyltransferase n=1 Tax=Kribbella yunnanensis TaxID=190194 RepID=A0ABP4S3H6_9ACTN